MKTLFLLVLSALLAACRGQTTTPLPTPQVVAKECTTEGCGTSLTVILDGHIPADFVMQVQSPDAPPLEVHCIEGEGQYSPDHFNQDSFMLCQGELVEIINFSPPAFLITVTTDGRSISRDFTPRYDLIYPNGPGCEPECLVGSVVFSITPPLSFDTATYRDETAGFEFDYPAEWFGEGPQVVGERGYIAQVTSYPY